MNTMSSTVETDAAKDAAADPAAREEAAEVCALMASSNSKALDTFATEASKEEAVDLRDAVDGIKSPAASLARAAYWHCGRVLGKLREERECWAEAEALLRDGWMPGEE